MAKRPPRRPRDVCAFSNPHGVYTYREVCELTKLSRQTIYGLRKKGLFPEPGKLTDGNKVFWPKPVIHRWLANRWEPDSPADDDGDDEDDADEDGGWAAPPPRLQVPLT